MQPCLGSVAEAGDKTNRVHQSLHAYAAVDWLAVMHPFKVIPLVAVLLVAGLKQPQVLSAADSKDSAALVPASERSAHFDAVNRQLELGGKLYGYVDVDGDTVKVGEYLRRIADSIAEVQPMAAAFLKQDYPKIFDDLGISDIKAVGLSSVQDAKGGFRNRVFFYMPNGRHGLLAGFGGSSAPYVYTKLAPANADLYGEGEVDIPAVYAAVKTVAARVGGESTAGMMESQLKAAGASNGISALQVIQSLKGRGVVIVRVDPEKNVALPGPQPFNVPAFSFLVRIDGLGEALEPMFAKEKTLVASQDGTMKIYSSTENLPIEGLKPVIAIDGKALFLASNIGFLQECLKQKSGLDQNPEFQHALAQVGKEGNGLVFVSPRLLSRIRQLDAINPEAAPEAKRILSLILPEIPEIKSPLVAVRINLPDGILVRSQWYRTMKQDLAILAVYNPVTIGAMAAMAIPAFQKVRTDSRDKIIQNNLRQFSSAAQQYMLENAKDVAKYDDLVGPNKYIKELKPVAGEDYKSLVVHSTDESISVRTADGKVISCRL